MKKSLDLCNAYFINEKFKGKIITHAMIRAYCNANFQIRQICKTM